jgi:hypothetical protein
MSVASATCDIPGVLPDLDIGVVLQAGMGKSTRMTKQEKKTGACVTHFVAFFSFFPYEAEHECP